LRQVGETVESFGGVEPVTLRLLDVSLETLDTFTGEDADPQEIMEILSCSLPVAHARQRRWGNRRCCVRSSSSCRRPTPTLSQGTWTTTTRHRMSAMALALSGLGSWPP